MTPGEFVKQVRKEILEHNAAVYRELLKTTDPKTATDPYWIRVLAMYARLSDTDKVVLHEVCRNVIMDTVSCVFAVLDGVTILQGQEEGFRLIMVDSNEPLNGDLSDLWWSLEEGASRPDL